MDESINPFEPPPIDESKEQHMEERSFLSNALNKPSKSTAQIDV
jgi:hypothetical protein